MELKEVKNMRFLGQIKEIVLFPIEHSGGCGWWLGFYAAPFGDDIQKLTTARNELRIFRTLDACNKIAVEIINTEISPILEMSPVCDVRICN